MDTRTAVSDWSVALAGVYPMPFRHGPRTTGRTHRFRKEDPTTPSRVGDDPTLVRCNRLQATVTARNNCQRFNYANLINIGIVLVVNGNPTL